MDFKADYNSLSFQYACQMLGVESSEDLPAELKEQLYWTLRASHRINSKELPLGVVAMICSHHVKEQALAAEAAAIAEAEAVAKAKAQLAEEKRLEELAKEVAVKEAVEKEQAEQEALEKEQAEDVSVPMDTDDMMTTKEEDPFEEV